jgi:CheY-like chemotaxis protein
MSENERPKSALMASANSRTDSSVIEGSVDTPGSDSRRTVLVVEDDPDTQALMKAQLRRHYEVVTAASEEEFWSVLEGLKPCLILMDLSLEGSQDGLTLTRQFRADSRRDSIPVVALTAHVTTGDRERAIAAGCALYISKPVDRRRLLDLIGSLIRP